MTIIYYASNDTMGETSADDCDRFREWAREQITEEYPDAEVEVSSRESSAMREVDILWGDDDPDFAIEEQIIDFCHNLWGKMEW